MVSIKSLLAVATIAISSVAADKPVVAPVNPPELFGPYSELLNATSPSDAHALDARNLGFHVKTYYHTDCSGEKYNDRTAGLSDDGFCMDTNCQVGSFDILGEGGCPNGEVQISYWERPGCQGRWYGYGYTSLNTCHRAWTDGWKFQSVHMRCASPARDCVNQASCSYNPEPAKGLCQL